MSTKSNRYIYILHQKDINLDKKYYSIQFSIHTSALTYEKCKKDLSILEFLVRIKIDSRVLLSISSLSNTNFQLVDCYSLCPHFIVVCRTACGHCLSICNMLESPTKSTKCEHGEWNLQINQQYLMIVFETEILINKAVISRWLIPNNTTSGKMHNKSIIIIHDKKSQSKNYST